MARARVDHPWVIYHKLAVRASEDALIASDSEFDGTGATLHCFGETSVQSYNFCKFWKSGEVRLCLKQEPGVPELCH